MKMNIREENLARLTKKSEPLDIEELLSLLSVAKEQNGNLAVHIDGELLTARHIRIVHLLDRGIERRLASIGLAEVFGYNPDQPDVYLEINQAVSRL